MPKKLSVLAPTRQVRRSLEAALTPAALADCYSFVLEVGTMPDCLLAIFTADPPNTATSSFIFKVGGKELHV
jgi:hypothetical protein